MNFPIKTLVISMAPFVVILQILAIISGVWWAVPLGLIITAAVICWTQFVINVIDGTTP